MSELSSAELRRIFDSEIRGRYERKLGSPVARPTFVLVGGQPGSGKTDLASGARLDMPSVISVAGDELRRFHPQYAELMRTDPLRMPDATQQAADAWVRKSLDFLRERGASVLLETTLRNPDAVQKTLGEFRAAGYEVELRVLAVPETLSRLGTVERYVGQVKSDGAGRWAPSAVHDEAYSRAGETLSRSVDAGLVDRVIVQQRDNLPLLDARVSGEDPFTVRNVMSALTDGRKIESMTPGQAAGWLRDMERASDFLADNPQVMNEDVARTVQRLAADTDAVARAAHPYDVRRMQEAAVRVDRVGARMPDVSKGVADRPLSVAERLQQKVAEKRAEVSRGAAEDRPTSLGKGR